MLPLHRGIYAQRTSAAWSSLSDQHFEAAVCRGQSDALHSIGGGCLDAPDLLPAGSTRGYGEGRGAYAMSVQYPRPDLVETPQALDAALSEAIAARRLARQRAARPGARLGVPCIAAAESQT